MTWASFPGPTKAPQGLYFISDIGINGSLWYNNGTSFVPIAPVILSNINKGWIVPSMAAANAATYSQSGVTLTVTCPAHTMIAALNGADIYLAMGTPATGVTPTAPVYANWFTNFQYVDVDTFTCTAGNSQLGTGAINTNTSETYVLELEQTIKGGILSSNGSICTWCTQARSGDGSTKTTRVYYNTTPYHTPIRTTNSQSDRWYSEINTSNSDQYVSVPNSIYNGFTNSAGVYNKYAIDTTIDRKHKISMQSSAALAYQAIMSYRVEIVR